MFGFHHGHPKSSYLAVNQMNLAQKSLIEGCFAIKLYKMNLSTNEPTNNHQLFFDAGYVQFWF